MLCKKCGSEISDTLSFCPNCGEPTNNIDFNNINDNIVNDDINLNTFNTQPEISTENQGIQPDFVQPVLEQSEYNQPVINQQPEYNPTMVEPQPEYNQPVVEPQPEYSQPVVEPQPIYNQVDQQFNNFNQNMNTDEKKNNGLIIVIVGIAVALLICGAIVVKSTLKNGKSNNNSNSNSNSVVNSDSNSNTTSNATSNVTTSNATSNTTTSNTTTSNTTTTPVASGTTFKGFVFQIPKTYKVSANSSQLQLIGTNNVDVAIIDIIDGKFDSLKSSNAAIKTYMENAGFQVTKIEIKTINGVEFIYSPVKINGKYMMLSYAKLSNNKILMLVTGNTSYTIDYKPIITFAPMVSSARAA